MFLVRSVSLTRVPGLRLTYLCQNIASKQWYSQEPIEQEVTFGKLAEEASLILKSSIDRGVALEKFQDHDALDKMEAKIADTYRPRPSDYLYQIHQFLSKNDLKSALNVLERDMRQEYVKPAVGHFRLLIHACGKVGHVRKAYELYKEYVSRSLDWNHGILADMFNACANASEKPYALAKAKQLRLNLAKRNVQMSKVTYHNMLKAFGRCGDLELAFSILDEMKTKNVLIDSETLNHLLHGCVSDKEAGFRHAIAAWKLVEKKKVRPDSFSYKLLLRATQECGAGDQSFYYDILLACMTVEEAREHRQKVLNSGQAQSQYQPGPNNGEMIENGLQTVDRSQLVANQANHLPNVLHQKPNLNGVIGLGSLLTPQNRFLILGGLDGFFAHLKSQKIKPDIITFTLVLNLIPDNVQAEADLLQKIGHFDVKPDIDFFNQLIKRRAMRKDYAHGKDTLQLVNKFGLSIDIMTYGNLALCCDSRVSALDLLRDMEENSYKPTIEILHVFLKGAAMRKSPRDVLLFMQIMDRNAIKPNPRVLKTLEKFNQIFKNLVKQWERGEKDLYQLPKPMHYEVKNGFEYWTKFAHFYKSWLRKTEMDPLEHPLKQYLTDKDMKKADEGVPYLKRIIDHSDS
ncbi:hypothetical protein TCAL_07477 [Tigriopus californicus]|uniref:PROP1-like PPR domain-containing protein n=1 Tax=Tigriopus californicus TaxID=6832 RepID=A0A553NS92_TIGCA|nr:pentatricopeptide repeat-containing protein 1, mitochondrial-like [Tigriopus californicus]TRY68306.1 hypothetical protein TCAL_07477 [Tigriopus californicus]|eukprot:TCALIF_07477-PA protein Name:"Similar to PTCD1 Pentatricopeptide repeat-containing protein 1, mitochondrial (Pongo abelii)" AED:0.02 eAED:0.02 QI:0/-1/0/1/-1/1/1/0/628